MKTWPVMLALLSFSLGGLSLIPAMAQETPSAISAKDQARRDREFALVMRHECRENLQKSFERAARKQDIEFSEDYVHMTSKKICECTVKKLSPRFFNTDPKLMGRLMRDTLSSCAKLTFDDEFAAKKQG